MNLTCDIDKCLKKVNEGVDIFEDLWQKIYSTTNVNIKEKHEADLKKEIKKLQRSRDCIKAWLTSPDVKDKEILSEYKKLIETQMERFKVVEKETKTKMYSKEGLGAMAKVDPKEKEKEIVANWLSHSIESLCVQMDQLESQLEGLTVRKKKLDRDKQDQADTYKQLCARHGEHIEKLELIMRLLDNDALSTDQINRIKEDVDYYVTTSCEAEFVENMCLYDELNLDVLKASIANKVVENLVNVDDDMSTTFNFSDTTSLPSSSCPSPTPSNLSHSTVNKEDLLRERKKSHCDDFQVAKSTISASSKPQHSVSSSNLPGKSQPFSVRSNGETHNYQPTSHSIGNAAVMPVQKQNYAQVASLGVYSRNDCIAKLSEQKLHSSSEVNSNASQKSFIVGTTTTASSPKLMKHQKQSNHASVGHDVVVEKKLNNLKQESKNIQSNSNSSDSTLTSLMNSSTSVSANHFHPVSIVTINSVPGSINAIDEFNDDAESYVRNILNNNSPRDDLLTSTRTTTFTNTTTSNSTSDAIVPATNSSWPFSSSHNMTSVSISSHINGLTPSSTLIYSVIARPRSVSPLGNFNCQIKPSFNATVPSMIPEASQQKSFKIDAGCAFSKISLTSDESYDLERLTAASERKPKPGDSRSRIGPEEYFLSNQLNHENQILQKNFYSPCIDVLTRENFFQNLSFETLFFAFYYMEGTLCQILAAKALKQQSWRFHTKYFTWFQRTTDPLVLTEEFEQGAYTYFDFAEWVLKDVTSFTFEYKYLEDKEL